MNHDILVTVRQFFFYPGYLSYLKFDMYLLYILSFRTHSIHTIQKMRETMNFTPLRAIVILTVEEAVEMCETMGGQLSRS